MNKLSKKIFFIDGIRTPFQMSGTGLKNYNCYDLGKYFAILPPSGELQLMYDKLNLKYSKVKENFSYSSYNNDSFLNVEEIRKLIKLHLDSNFEPI